MPDEPVSTPAPEITPPADAAPGPVEVRDPLGPPSPVPTPAPVEPDPAAPPEPKSDDALPPDPAKPFTWDGGVENLPKELQERGKGMLDHMHKVTQEAAQVKQTAAAYQELVNHPEFKEFLDWQDKKKSTGLPPAAPASPGITEEELLAAQTDPQHFQTLLNKGISEAVQPLAKGIIDRLGKLEYNLELGRREREIESFGQNHKDFWDIDSRIMKAVIDDVVVKNKGTLEDAYKTAKTIEKQYLDKAQSDMTKRVQDKKAAVTASPTKPGEPNVIYVENAKDATRVAFENAQQGKHVDVRVRRNKK